MEVIFLVLTIVGFVAFIAMLVSMIFDKED